MVDEFIRSFDEVYLVYPTNNRFYEEPKGVYMPLRHMDKNMFLMSPDPEYPHMILKYFFNNHHKKRLRMWQQDELNYYKQERRWIPAPFKEQRSKEI